MTRHEMSAENGRAAVESGTDVPDDLRGMPDFMVSAILERRAEEAMAERAAVHRGDTAAEHARRSRAGSRNSASVVFTLRPAHDDFAMLQGQAAERSIPPSVLARNVLRRGLRHPETSEPRDREDDLAALAQRVRSAASRVGSHAVR